MKDTEICQRSRFGSSAWQHIMHNQPRPGAPRESRRRTSGSPCPPFKADPHRTDDFEVDRLAREVNPSTTLLESAAVPGRFALPLALRCHHVTVVEPSPGMGASLRHLAAEAGIENVTIVAKQWEEAEVEPADIVLSAHVIYMIADIRPFVIKLVEHARQKVCMPTFIRPPKSRFAPFWRRVHGEEKQTLPGAAEFMQVLWEMDIYPHLEMFEAIPFRTFKNWQKALETLRQRLFVMPDTEKDALAAAGHARFTHCNACGICHQG